MMASSNVLSPVVNPAFPPNTPANIVQAYEDNANCVCLQDDPTCSNCLTVMPEYLMQTRDAPAIGAIIVLPILAFIVVALRTYSRAFVIKKLGYDDFLALFSLALYIPFQVLSIILIRLGSGRHLAYIQFVVAQSDFTLNQTEVLDFVAHVLYTTALFICRLSGIAFYLRLLDRSKSWTVMLCKVSAGLLFLGFIPQIILLIVHCNPVTGLWPYGWQPEAGKYTCLAWGVVYSTNSAISLVCDILLLSIAIIMLAGWNISRRNKILLMPVLLPGALVLGISIVRLYLVVQGQWEADQSWWYDPMLAIENAEICSTLIALCAPGLKPLIVMYHERYQTYHRNSSSKIRGRGISLPEYGWRNEGSRKCLRELRASDSREHDESCDSLPAA